jgi:hypothetical protein
MSALPLLRFKDSATGLIYLLELARGIYLPGAMKASLDSSKIETWKTLQDSPLFCASVFGSRTRRWYRNSWGALR